MNDDIHRADPGFRHRLLIVLLVVVALGTLAVHQLTSFLETSRTLGEVSMQEAAARTLGVGRVLFASLAAGALGMGIFLLQLAVRVTRDERFPPPDAKVLRDTPVLRHQPALQRARHMKWLGAALLIAGLVVPAFAEYKLRTVLAPALEAQEDKSRPVGS